MATAADSDDAEGERQRLPPLQPDPVQQAYAMRQEYAAALAHPVPGLYPLPSAVDPHLWYGCLFVRHGPYRGHLVRFALRAPPDFPCLGSACPQVTLAPLAPFHPHVCPVSGRVDLRGFPVWRPGMHRLWQLLHHLRRMLARVDLPPQGDGAEAAVGQCANPEAARLFFEDKEAFRSRLARDAEDSLVAAPADATNSPPPGDDPAAQLWQLASADNALTDEGGEFEELRATMLEEASTRELADAWAVGAWQLLGRRRMPRVPTWMDRGTMRVMSYQ